MEANDSKILELKKQIEEKKKKIKKSKKFTPNTNCVLTFQGITNNINVLNEEQLINLHINLVMFYNTAIDLDYNDVKLSGYSLPNWIEDVQSKIENLSIKKEVSKLNQMEEKLHQLLSNDKKVELEISAIEDMLK